MIERLNRLLLIDRKINGKGSEGIEKLGTQGRSQIQSVSSHSGAVVWLIASDGLRPHQVIRHPVRNT
jgi:hypothetical protein